MVKSVLPFYLFTFLLLSGCHNATVPDTFAEVNKAPKIYPDYCDVTVPLNIAPLTFEWDGKADEVVARFRAGDAEVVCGGDKVQPDMDQWHTLTANATGKAMSVEVFVRSGEQWSRYKPFSIYVSGDSIDPYISYRLISPSYVTYEELTLNQRCLENYDERVMVDNMLCSTELSGQCVNCHNYQQYDPNRMQFHARQKDGGTVISYNGQFYSTNNTGQSFHTRNLNKIEVFDSASDLIAYDVQKNEVTNIENDTTEFEVFPCWAPDGKTLYYCSAHFEFRDTASHDREVIMRAKEIKYNLYKKSFDTDTYTFGPRQLVYRADSLGRSVTLPRVSPDGRYLMFTIGNYGVFHIWHHEADLCLMNLADGSIRPMDEINSADTESYHSWSSNGRWVIFSSRRDDGGYTRPFIAHIDADGRGSKPFELPQADPDYHRQFMKSYNIPEFMKGPVDVKPQDFARLLKNSNGDAVKYVGKLKK